MFGGLGLRLYVYCWVQSAVLQLFSFFEVFKALRDAAASIGFWVNGVCLGLGL